MELQMTDPEKVEALALAHENAMHCVRRFGISDERTHLAINACRAVENAIYEPCLKNTLNSNVANRALAEALGVDVVAAPQEPQP